MFFYTTNHGIDMFTTTCYYVVVVRNTTYLSTILEGNTVENITEMLKGVLEGCVLEIIGRQETYGYEITSALRQLGFTDVVEGTIYTILLRLEQAKLVHIEKKSSEMGPPRKCYTLNSAGRKELALFWEKWNFVSSRITTLRGKRHE